MVLLPLVVGVLPLLELEFKDILLLGEFVLSPLDLFFNFDLCFQTKEVCHSLLVSLFICEYV